MINWNQLIDAFMIQLKENSNFSISPQQKSNLKC